MLDEINDELFDLCEDAVNEIVSPFLQRMRDAHDGIPENEWDSKENELIEEELKQLTLAQRFTIACYIIDFREDVANGDNPLPDHQEMVDWFHLQWQCDQEN